MSADHKIIIITAPSGSGKSTIVQYLLKNIPSLAFSVSACTRLPRANEKEGINYYFLSPSDFSEKIEQDAFLEYEMVYPGKYYGTLKSELTRIWLNNQVPLVDIDVQGALRILKNKDYHCLSIFIQPPSIEELEKRLLLRGTETPESLQERVEKAKYELTFATQFHHQVINDQLQTACEEVATLIKSFI